MIFVVFLFDILSFIGTDALQIVFDFINYSVITNVFKELLGIMPQLTVSPISTNSVCIPWCALSYLQISEWISPGGRTSQATTKVTGLLGITLSCTVQGEESVY